MTTQSDNIAQTERSMASGDMPMPGNGNPVVRSLIRDNSAPPRPKRRYEDEIETFSDLQYLNDLLMECTARGEMRWRPFPRMRFRELILRRWGPEDLEDLQNIINGTNPRKLSSFQQLVKYVKPKRNASKFLKSASKAWENTTSFDYVLVHRGMVKGAMQMKPSTEHAGTVELAFKTAPWALGQSITVAGVAIMILKAFDMGFGRVWITEKEGDTSIQEVVKTLGFWKLGLRPADTEEGKINSPRFLWQLVPQWRAPEFVYEALLKATEMDAEGPSSRGGGNGYENDDHEDDDLASLIDESQYLLNEDIAGMVIDWNGPAALTVMAGMAALGLNTPELAGLAGPSVPSATAASPVSTASTVSTESQNGSEVESETEAQAQTEVTTDENSNGSQSDSGIEPNSSTHHPDPATLNDKDTGSAVDSTSGGGTTPEEPQDESHEPQNSAVAEPVKTVGLDDVVQVLP